MKSFKATHLRSQLLGDGLIHMFGRTREMRRASRSQIDKSFGWATFCQPALSHNNLPGETMVVADTTITCIRCLVAYVSKN